MDSKITPSLENYLETIYLCIEKYGEARVTDLAHEIGISKPSVNQAVRTLSGMGLVEYEKYSLLTLTAEGYKKAEAIHHRHHIFMDLLVDVFGVPAETANVDACLMEHAVSEITVQKLDEFLKKYKDIRS